MAKTTDSRPRTSKAKAPEGQHPYARLRSLARAAAARGVSHLEGRALQVIAYFTADADGACYPSTPTIAAELGYKEDHPKALHRAIVALEAKGLLRIHRKRSKRNLRAIVGYTVLFDAPEAADTGPRPVPIRAPGPS